MSNPFKTEDFKKLQTAWAKKLKQSGFEDAEDKGGMLKVHSKRFTLKDRLRYNLKYEYYSLAQDFLNSHLFESKDDKLIWRLHCEGRSIRKIQTKFPGRTRWSIHNVLTKLKTEMLSLWKKNHNL